MLALVCFVVLCFVCLVGLHDTTTHNKEKKCEPGWFCENGQKYHCDRGYYGAEFGMVSQYNYTPTPTPTPTPYPYQPIYQSIH